MAEEDLRRWKREFQIDRNHSSTWRKLAKEWFDFYSGEQWRPEDEAYLRDKLRPVITFNRSAIMINAVVGSEIQNRPETVFSAVEPGDVMPNNILQGAGEWFDRTADAGFAESEAFLHTTVCGMGWTETVIDYDDNPQGLPKMTVPDPLEMYWDASAKSPNLKDARRLWRVVEYDIDEAKALFPDIPVTDLHADWTMAEMEGTPAVDQDQANRYEDDSTNANTSNGVKGLRTTVLIVHRQWKEKVDQFYLKDPQTGKDIWLSPDDYKKVNARLEMSGMPPVNAVKMKKTVYKQAFIGRTVLDEIELPVNSFTWGCITGYKHHTKRTWYGLIAGLKSPQEWANKWLSQALHILNSNAKGGVAVETGAVEDVTAFEDSWAKQDEVTWLRPGGKERIMPKIGSNPSPQFFQMMEFAITSIRDTVGVNLEQLGMRGAVQANSLEQSRKEAGQAVLSPIIDALRSYMVSQGRRKLMFIQKYLSDGRLIRIMGETNAQYVPLALEQDAVFDVDVDQTSTGPNMKERVWSFIAPMMDRIPPQVLIELLPFSPLPATVVASVQNALRQVMQPDPSVEQKKQLELAKLQADIGMTQANTQRTMSEAQTQPKIDMAKLFLDGAKQL